MGLLLEKMIQHSKMRSFYCIITRSFIHTANLYIYFIILQLTIKLPVLLHLFTPGPQTPLNFRMLNHLMQPEFSSDGSNRKKKEYAMYSVFEVHARGSK